MFAQKGRAKLKRTVFPIIALAVSVGLSGCGTLNFITGIGATTPVTRNIALPDGPPVEEIITIFDEALECLRGHIPEGVTFAVGEVVDATGRESYSDGAAGRFISQGAGEMVQSSLFRAGAAVVNRRDPQIIITDTQWGIRDISQQTPVNFYISGSINSLDFIPGGGVSATVAGVGPRYRQSRILVGMDLSMTDAFSGRIVASVPLQRQMFSREVGASIGRFFGDTLVSLDAGGQQREAVHFVLRQMISLATFELVGQVVEPSHYRACRASIQQFVGNQEFRENGAPEAIRDALSNAVEDAAQDDLPAEPEQAVVSAEDHVSQLASQASILAARAIAAAEEALSTDSPEVRAQQTAMALQLVRAAGQYLQRAAELGLDGPEGDATAVVVERAFEIVLQANEALAAQIDEQTSVEAPGNPVATETPEPPEAAVPGTPGYERVQGE